MTVTYHVGDTREVIATIPDGSVDLIASSPPFLALRSYVPADHASKGDEIGSERNPAEFIDMLLGLTAEWGRVLAPHGSIAIELGDTYAGAGGASGDHSSDDSRSIQRRFVGGGSLYNTAPANPGTRSRINGNPGWPRAKSLALIPQLYAVALAYGINPLTGQPSPAGKWLVRNKIVWHRPNPAVGALGDKVRPSTSYIVVATRSAKRWFDLTAVRNGQANEKHAIGFVDPHDAARQEVGLSSGNGWTGVNPAGAPPLDAWFDHYDGSHDTWTLTTQPSRLAHYAMWPAKLAERLILSMCPREVCRICGEPRRRVEQLTEHGDDDARRQARSQERLGGGATGSRHIQLAQPTTLGWTDCGCVCLACDDCGTVLGLTHERTSTMPGMRTGNRGGMVQVSGGTEEAPVLLEALLEQGECAESAVDQRLRDDTQGLQVSSSAESPDGRQEWVSVGASTDRVGATRASADLGRGGTSHQRSEDGQPTGEPGSDGEAGARSSAEAPRLAYSTVSALWRDDPSSQPCPNCSTGHLRPVGQFRAGVALDPFCGSGTTLAVADLHGRDAIGIDFDARNKAIYPARYDEVKRALFGTMPELPGQGDLFADEVPA